MQCGHNTQSVEFLHCSYRRPAQHSPLPGPACPASVRVVARRPLRRRKHRRPRTRRGGQQGHILTSGHYEGRGCSDERCAATRGHPDSAPPPPRPHGRHAPPPSGSSAAPPGRLVLALPPFSLSLLVRDGRVRPQPPPAHTSLQPGLQRSPSTEAETESTEAVTETSSGRSSEDVRRSSERQHSQRMLHRYGGWQVVTTNHRQSGSPPAAGLQRMERVNYPKMAS